jgi:hypothetical protein
MSSKLAEDLTLLTCILEFTSSNLTPDSDYVDGFSLAFPNRSLAKGGFIFPPEDRRTTETCSG